VTGATINVGGLFLGGGHWGIKGGKDHYAKSIDVPSDVQIRGGRAASFRGMEERRVKKEESGGGRGFERKRETAGRPDTLPSIWGSPDRGDLRSQEENKNTGEKGSSPVGETG